MKQLVRLRMRPSRDGKRKCVSLGHADRRKAKRQQAEKERELQMALLPQNP